MIWLRSLPCLLATAFFCPTPSVGVMCYLLLFCGGCRSWAFACLPICADRYWIIKTTYLLVKDFNKALLCNFFIQTPMEKIMTKTTNSPKRPYFLRAMHEWLSDNDYTVYIMVDASHSQLVAPKEYAQDGRLVLNASYQATKDLHIDNQAMTFSARFGGVSQDLWIPMAAILAIYAKEDPEHAFFFPQENFADSPATDEPTPKKPKGKPKLTIIK